MRTIFAARHEYCHYLDPLTFHFNRKNVGLIIYRWITSFQNTANLLLSIVGIAHAFVVPLIIGTNKHHGCLSLANRVRKANNRSADLLLVQGLLALNPRVF